MRALLIAAIVFGGAIPAHLNAQRGGAGGAGGAGGGAGGGMLGRPVFGNGGSLGGRGTNAMGRGWNTRSAFSGIGYGGYGWGYSAYSDYGWPGAYADDTPAPPSVVVVMPMQPAPEFIPPPPPVPARPVMHEYAWPNDGGDRQATFSIVSRDSSVYRALAVWVQDNQVRYTAADGRPGRIQPAAIDCGATDRLNAEKRLKLSLPGCPASR